MISEQLGVQCSQALSLFHAYTGCDLPSSMFGIVKKWMKCVVWFSFSKYLCRPDLRPNQPYHQFPEFGMSGTPRLCWIGPKTVIKPLSAKPQNGFPPMARSLWTQYHQHSMQTCIDGRCFHKDAKLPCPTVWGWEWHDRTKVWVPCLDELPDTSWDVVCWCIVDVQLCAG